MHNKPFTIAIVDCTTAFGGAFEVGVSLAKHLGTIDGVQAHFLSAQPPEVLERRGREGISFHHLPLAKWVPKGPGLLGHGVSLARTLYQRELPAARRLRSLIKRLDVSVVHLNNALNPQLHGAIAAWRAGVPCVCSCRGYTSPSRLVQKVEPLVDRHIPVSRMIGNHLEAVNKIPPHKIVPLPDPVDTDLFHPDIPPADLEGLFGIPRGRKVFSIFGRLVDWKGIDVFLRASRIVLEQLPDAHAMIVGDVGDGDPAYGEHLKQMAVDLGIADRTTFTGFRTDVGPLMCASDLLVHASTTAEPFGTALLEGMACGLPYVAMDEGGPAEMIIPGVQGLLVRPNQPEAMAQAIVSILSQPGYADQLGKAARERCLSEYSAPKVTRRFLELYREVVEERAHTRKTRVPAGAGSHDRHGAGTR